MKIATWNVNSLRVRMPHLLDWLASEKPDAVGVQETKCTDEVFPHEPLQSAGYHAVINGQKSYNGVAILVRDGLDIADPVRDMPGFEDPQKRVIAATVGGVRVVNIYVVNGQSVGSEKFEYKLRWLLALKDYLQGELATHPLLAVTGDFNIAPADEDVHDPAAWAGSVLCSKPERAAFAELLELGLKDSFRLFPQSAGTYTWWDYRQAAFRRNLGLRIDHVLVSPALAQHCTGCLVTLAPRRLDKPSDHAPVLAEFTL